MYLVQEKPTEGDIIMKILREGWEKGDATDELVLSQGGCVEEMIFIFQNGNRDYSDVEKYQ